MWKTVPSSTSSEKGFHAKASKAQGEEECEPEGTLSCGGRGIIEEERIELQAVFIFLMLHLHSSLCVLVPLRETYPIGESRQRVSWPVLNGISGSEPRGVGSVVSFVALDLAGSGETKEAAAVLRKIESAREFVEVYSVVPILLLPFP